MAHHPDALKGGVVPRSPVRQKVVQDRIEMLLGGVPWLSEIVPEYRIPRSPIDGGENQEVGEHVIGERQREGSWIEYVCLEKPPEIKIRQGMAGPAVNPDR